MYTTVTPIQSQSRQPGEIRSRKWRGASAAAASATVSSSRLRARRGGFRIKAAVALHGERIGAKLGPLAQRHARVALARSAVKALASAASFAD